MCKVHNCAHCLTFITFATSSGFVYRNTAGKQGRRVPGQIFAAVYQIQPANGGGYQRGQTGSRAERQRR